VENAEQMRMLLRSGTEYVLTSNAEHVSEELYKLLVGTDRDGDTS
jgi:hypothetical protein